MKVAVIYTEDLSVQFFEVDDTEEATLRETIGLSEEREYERWEDGDKVVHAFINEESYQAESVYVVE